MLTKSLKIDKNTGEEYKAHFIPVARGLHTYRTKILCEYSKHVEILHEGASILAASKHILLSYNGEAVVKHLQESKYIFITKSKQKFEVLNESDLTSLNSITIMKKKTSPVLENTKTINAKKLWSKDDYDHLYRGTVEEVALKLNRSEDSIINERKRVQKELPEVYEKLTTNFKEEIYNEIHNTTKMPLTRKFYELDEDLVILSYAKSPVVAAKILGRQYNSVSQRKKKLLESDSLSDRLKYLQGEIKNNPKNVDAIVQQFKNKNLNETVKPAVEEEQETSSIRQIDFESVNTIDNHQPIVDTPTTNLPSVMVEEVKQFSFNVHGLNLVFSKQPSGIRIVNDTIYID